MSDLRSSARLGAKFVLSFAYVGVAMIAPMAAGLYFFGEVGGVAGFLVGIFVAATGMDYFTH